MATFTDAKLLINAVLENALTADLDVSTRKGTLTIATPTEIYAYVGNYREVHSAAKAQSENANWNGHFKDANAKLNSRAFGQENAGKDKTPATPPAPLTLAEQLENAQALMKEQAIALDTTNGEIARLRREIIREAKTAEIKARWEAKMRAEMEAEIAAEIAALDAPVVEAAPALAPMLPVAKNPGKNATA